MLLFVQQIVLFVQHVLNIVISTNIRMFQLLRCVLFLFRICLCHRKYCFLKWTKHSIPTGKGPVALLCWAWKKLFYLLPEVVCISLCERFWKWRIMGSLYLSFLKVDVNISDNKHKWLETGQSFKRANYYTLPVMVLGGSFCFVCLYLGGGSSFDWSNGMNKGGFNFLL